MFKHLTRMFSVQDAAAVAPSDDRFTLARRRQEVEAQLVQTLDAHRNGLQPLLQRELEAQRAYEAAQEARVRLQQAQRDAAHAIDRELGRLTAQLAGLNTPAISEAIAAVREDMTVTLTSRRSMELSRAHGARRDGVWSNTDSVNARWEALRAAIGRLEALRLEPVPDGDLPKAIADAISDLPEVQQRPDSSWIEATA